MVPLLLLPGQVGEGGAAAGVEVVGSDQAAAGRDARGKGVVGRGGQVAGRVAALDAEVVKGAGGQAAQRLGVARDHGGRQRRGAAIGRRGAVLDLRVGVLVRRPCDRDAALVMLVACTALMVGGVMSGPPFETVTLTGRRRRLVAGGIAGDGREVCAPLVAPFVAQATLYGELVSSAPRLLPSSLNWTPVTPMLSVALAVTLMPPDTVALFGRHRQRNCGRRAVGVPRR